MRISGAAVFSLFLAAVAAYAVLAAWSWPLKAKLFPLAIGIPLLVLALTQLVLELRGKAQAGEGLAMDRTHTAEVPAKTALRRTAVIFGWMTAFVVLVLLLGFSLAVPVFVFSYLVTQSSAGWGLAIALTAAAWAFFHGLFERLLHFPFETGLLQTWLGV